MIICDFCKNIKTGNENLERYTLPVEIDDSVDAINNGAVVYRFQKTKVCDKEFYICNECKNKLTKFITILSETNVQ